MIFQLFFYRYDVTGKGRLPKKIPEDLTIGGNRDLSLRNLGMLPFLTLATDLVVVLISNHIFQF
ncbi:hypothetical protein I5535_11005 [Rhodobacteraceae bacterium F11138]|nr:hypothetical protein [Rhodobacteraceae bacterium F11138]